MPLSQTITIAICVISLMAKVSLSAASSESLDRPNIEAVNFIKAYQRALAFSPNARYMILEKDILDGKVTQASLVPNPVLSAEVENVLGSGPFKGAEGMELTLGLSQLIELGGKRTKRKHLAESKRGLAEWTYQAFSIDLYYRVQQAFTAILIAQERVQLNEKQVELSKQLVEAVVQQVKAARMPQLEATRFQIELAAQEIKLDKSKQTLILAKQVLALMWGSLDIEPVVTGILALEEDIPPIDDLIALLEHSIDLSGFPLVKSQACAALTLEQSKAIPDVDVFGGIRYFESGAETTFVFGVSLPFPLFDQNQGNVRSAKARIKQIDSEEKITRQRLKTQLIEQYSVLVSSSNEAKRLDKDVAPLAKEAFDKSSMLYRQDQYTFLEFLDSQRILFEAQAQYIDALERYYQAFIAIKRIVSPLGSEQ